MRSSMPRLGPEKAAMKYASRLGIDSFCALSGTRGFPQWLLTMTALLICFVSISLYAGCPG